MLRRIGSESAYSALSGAKPCILFLIESADNDTAPSVVARFNSNALNVMGLGGSKDKTALLVVEPEWVINLVSVCQTVMKETPTSEWSDSLDSLEDLIMDFLRDLKVLIGIM